MDCVICFETFNGSSSENGEDEGVHCPSGHFVCTPDFQQYMYETVLCQVFKLRRNKGRISCPVPECSDCIHSLMGFDRLAERERLRYLNILSQENSDESSNVQRVKAAMLDLLTLRCPNPQCREAVDISSDGCSAVMCLHCGCYFCNFCFKGYGYPNSSAVAAERDAFLPMAIVSEGQRNHTTNLLVRFCTLAMSSREYGVDGAADLSMAMIFCFKDFQTLGIDPMHIWTAALSSIQGIEPAGQVLRGETNPPSNDEYPDGTTVNAVEPEAAPAERATLSPSAQLALAISTSNSTAANQLLHNAEGLDVNYVAPNLDAIAIALIEMGASVLPGPEPPARSIIEMHPNIPMNEPVHNERENYRPIHVVARYNHGHLVRCLVERGASLEIEESELSYTPLTLALVMKHEWVAEELILAGADSISVPPSPLYFAAEKGMSSIIRLVYELHKEDANLVSIMNRPAVLWVENNVTYTQNLVHVAVIKKQLGVLSLLIELGLDLNAPNQFGDTPLFAALLAGEETLAYALVRGGARVDIPSPHANRFPM
eukprot:gene25726-34303_t